MSHVGAGQLREPEASFYLVIKRNCISQRAVIAFVLKQNYWDKIKIGTTKAKEKMHILSYS